MRNGQKRNISASEHFVPPSELEALLFRWTSGLNLEATRSSSIKTVSLAVWRAERRVAQILAPRGHIQPLGFWESGIHFLLPEEALFLLEHGSLALYEPNPYPIPTSESTDAFQILSIQAAYERLIHSHPDRSYRLPLYAYLVYAQLRQLGYSLRRHSENDTGSSELDPVYYQATPPGPGGEPFIVGAVSAQSARAPEQPAPVVRWGVVAPDGTVSWYEVDTTPLPPCAETPVPPGVTKRPPPAPAMHP